MPKIVDHEERRREVLDATWRVIARGGLHGATLRAIADEAGYSIGVLVHYFADKEDIMISAHQLAFARAGERIRLAVEAHSGLDALHHAILEALPLDEERHLEAQVDVSFLGQIVGNERLRQIRSDSNSKSRTNWRVLLTAAQMAGDVPAELDPVPVADEILAHIESLSTEALINPSWMTPDRQHLLTERLLARIAGR